MTRPASSKNSAPAATNGRERRPGSSSTPATVADRTLSASSDEAHAAGEVGQVAAGPGAAPAQPLQDELAADGVVSDLLGRELLRVEHGGDRVVRAPARRIRSGHVQG